VREKFDPEYAEFDPNIWLLSDPEYAEFDPNIRLQFLARFLLPKSFGHSANSSTNPPPNLPPLPWVEALTHRYIEDLPQANDNTNIASEYQVVAN
jgi:hypothetical protein